jgi:hypothetical protein
MIVLRYADQLSYPGQGRGNGTSEIGRRATTDTSDGVAGRSRVSGAAQRVEKHTTQLDRGARGLLGLRVARVNPGSTEESVIRLSPGHQQQRRKDVIATRMNAVLIDFWWVLWQDTVWY